MTSEPEPMKPAQEHPSEPEAAPLDQAPVPSTPPTDPAPAGPPEPVQEMPAPTPAPEASAPPEPEQAGPGPLAPTEEAEVAREVADTDVENEVATAMAQMPPQDAAALAGDIPMTVDPGTPPEQIEPGTELTGTIVGASEDEVFIEFGARLQGVMARTQFGKKESVEKGRRVDVVADNYDAEAGLLNVSRQGQIQRATWANLAPGNIVEGRVTGLNKGGLEVDLKGIRAFMPASQVDLSPLKDISVLLNELVQCEVMEVDRRHKSVLLSRRKLMERQRAEARDTLLTDLEPGQTRRGVVGNITDFGAFVDLGGVDGLVHISDLSWGTVDRVGDVLKKGQEVEVKVLKIDRKRDRISLGLKQALPDPWLGVEDRYHDGTQLKVRVVRLADFGVFVELEPGVEGLIPISEMGWSRVGKTSDVAKVGDMVDALVIRVEPQKRRIALSMKQAQADPWADVLGSFAPQSLVTGKVTRLTDFGAFVELVPGVEGLVHISEMADRRVRSCDEIVQVGQETEVRVLGVDTENRRISLSIKAVHAPQESSAPMHEEKPDRRKPRKKPLRGGLGWEWSG